MICNIYIQNYWVMKSTREELFFFDNIFLSTKKDHHQERKDQSYTKYKILPFINTINHYFQPIDYKVYERLKRKHKLQLMQSNHHQVQDIKLLHLEGQMAHFSTAAPKEKYQTKQTTTLQVIKHKSKQRRQHIKVHDILNQTNNKLPFHSIQPTSQIYGKSIISQPFNFQRKIQPISKKNTLSSKNQKLVTTKSSSQRGKQKYLHPRLEQNHKSVRLIENKSKGKQQKPIVKLEKHELNQIKAESFIVMQYPSMKLIAGNRYKNTAEIASLTKIMTFYTVYRIIEQHCAITLQDIIKIDEQVSEMSGTTAQLILGDQITIGDLLYGLMLPSGNDAALALAKWAGAQIKVDKDDKEEILPYNAFLSAMNKEAKKIGLRNSIFVNPHGLPNCRGSSNPYDIAILIGQCLKIPLFCKIVSTKIYSTWINNEGIKRQLLWQNTNKLLRRKGFIGVKTGVTVTAGPCLATCYEKQEKIFITVLLRTNKLSRRFKQTRLILGSVLRHYDRQQYTLDYKQLMKSDAVLDSDNSEDQQQFKYEKMDARQFQKRNKILVYQL